MKHIMLDKEIQNLNLSISKVSGRLNSKKKIRTMAYSIFTMALKKPLR